MATRTTTTRTTSFARAPSAASSGKQHGHAGFSFEALAQAYIDCRRSKRNSNSALDFELDLERNLMHLHTELNSGTYQPGPSTCFVVTRPKYREVWAAAFRDRIVHHLLYNHVGARIEHTFIADSCACIPGRGTLYAAQRLERKARSITQNWKRPAHYLKCDLANFFVTIDKRVLASQLQAAIPEQPWQTLAQQILWHDPRESFYLRSPHRLVNRVPQHKRLAAQPAYLGLPIGNLSSQFFANIYLNALDQFVKHQLRARDRFFAAQVWAVRVVLVPAAELPGRLAYAGIAFAPPVRFSVVVEVHLYAVADAPANCDLAGLPFAARLAPNSTGEHVDVLFTLGHDFSGIRERLLIEPFQ